jgi:hypothetical protein
MPLKSLHEVDDIRGLPLLWSLDLLASLLLEQFFDRVLILILEFLRVELVRFRLNDMSC